MKRILGLLLLLVMNSSHAIDTTIRVLAVYPTGTAGDVSVMIGHLQMITESWTTTGLHTSSGVSVQILNAGNPIPLSLPGLPGTLSATPEWAYNHPTIVAQRNAYAADVIVIFHDGTDLCGAADHAFIDGNFVPTAGMDLRYRDRAYIAAVSNSTSCWSPVGAHEFGHLLGGGHLESSTTANPRLYADSRGYLRLAYGDFFNYNLATSLVSTRECVPNVPGGFCFFERRYSSNSPQNGNGNQQNARTMNLTALSVANYHQITPPNPNPILNPPINVHGFEIGCTAANETRHDVYWSPDPATNVQVTEYQIWYSQPPGQFPVYGWSLPEYQRFDDVYVFAADSRMTIRACTLSECSADSAPYLARWTCNF